ncbi:MAG: cytochrome b/b6 domain-containing protein [Archaeoglobales archaeon]|nr:MAG: cytochrome b/b6 domain-containing protein [Archaeoglobales archaeon]
MTHKEEYETIEVERHSALYRFFHWTIVSTGLIIGWTGWRLGGLYGVSFPDMKTALDIHVYLGFVFGAFWILLFIYVVKHEWEWFSPRRFPYSIKFFIQEILAWTGLGPHIEDPRGYDPERREYVEKLIPTEVQVLWMYLLMAAIMGITGFAMYYSDIFAPLLRFADQFAPLFNLPDGFTLFRAIHRLVMYLFLMTMLIHAYAVTIFGVLGSMITGKRREKVVRSRSK